MKITDLTMGEKQKVGIFDNSKRHKHLEYPDRWCTEQHTQNGSTKENKTRIKSNPS